MTSSGRAMRPVWLAVAAWFLAVGAVVGVWRGSYRMSDLDVFRATHDGSSSKRPAHQLDDSLLSALEQLHNAVATMQALYFDTFLGTWPRCIDWTAAVMGSYVAGSLYSMTRAAEYSMLQHNQPPRARSVYSRQSNGADRPSADEGRLENSIGDYFADTISYYYGQDAFSLRNQAYDDMLWVVLGWLDTIRFINEHDKRHYRPANDKWWGTKFKPAFSHRARIFYDLAAKGWDEKDCGGGMVWNPTLAPYKNAITNELFISASVNMYLYFPGDNNTSPFSMPRSHDSSIALSTQACEGMQCPARTVSTISEEDEEVLEAPAHAGKYLSAAIQGYDWLQHSGMRTSQGLYGDGFHISPHPRDTPGVCDIRNTMVYTYNQGVILSAQRGLWESTGNLTYLADGHKLISNVIAATCFELDEATQYPEDTADTRWCGLGRNGVLEEFCDAQGTCSQDGQTFKGIFFHHLTLFCESLPRVATVPSKSFTASDKVQALHRQSCEHYGLWIARNALAALNTRDSKGRFGGWWGAARRSIDSQSSILTEEDDDYRNLGLRNTSRWGVSQVQDEVQWHRPRSKGSSPANVDRDIPDTNQPQQALKYERPDPNTRGRGRTIETQGAGVAVVRAMWEFIFERFSNSGHQRVSSSWNELIDTIQT